MTHPIDRMSKEARAAYSAWTILTTLAVCGSYILTWMFLYLLAYLQG